MMQRTLPTDRDHDLPPRWDGWRVEWEGWTAPPDIFICPPPKPQPCRACGSFDEQIMNRGRSWSEPGAIRPYRRAKTYRQSEANQKADADGSVMLHLVAYRCPDCRADRVRTFGSFVNTAAELWWDLDESDYTDTGSRAR